MGRNDEPILINHVNLLKENNPDVVYIEQIVAINKQGKKINVEPFKVKR